MFEPHDAIIRGLGDDGFVLPRDGRVHIDRTTAALARTALFDSEYAAVRIGNELKVKVKETVRAGAVKG